MASGQRVVFVDLAATLWGRVFGGQQMWLQCAGSLGLGSVGLLGRVILHCRGALPSIAAYLAASLAFTH